MSEIKFCSNCGAPLRKDVQFCTECGTKVTGDVTPVAQPTPVSDTVQEVQPTTNQMPPQYTAPVYNQIPDENQKAKNDKQGKIIVGVFGVITALAIVFFVYKGFFSYPSKPEDVAKNCFNAMMIDFDAKEAQKYVELEEVEYDDIKDLCDSIKSSEIKIKKIKIVDTEIDGDYADVTLSMTASIGGETETEEGYVSLEKIDGKWKVVNFY